jgi:hypothetical protein
MKDYWETSILTPDNMELMSVEKERSRNVEGKIKIHSQAYRRRNCTKLHYKIYELRYYEVLFQIYGLVIKENSRSTNLEF